MSDNSKDTQDAAKMLFEALEKLVVPEGGIFELLVSAERIKEIESLREMDNVSRDTLEAILK